MPNTIHNRKKLDCLRKPVIIQIDVVHEKVDTTTTVYVYKLH